jgi:WD40 repeat protein
VSTVAISPDGRMLAVGHGSYEDGMTILWDLADPRGPRPLGEPLDDARPSTAMAFSADGRRLVSVGVDGTVETWDLADRVRVGPLFGEPWGSGGLAALSRDGSLLALTGNDFTTVLLWDLSDPAAPRRRGGPLVNAVEAVGSLAFSADGSTLAAADVSSTPLLWDVADRDRPQLLGRPPPLDVGGSASVAFSPDGRTLATGGSSGAHLWDINDPANPRLAQHLPVAGERAQVAFVPTDGTLVTTSLFRPGTHLWDVSDPAAPRQVGSVPAAAGEALAVSADGAFLATGAPARDDNASVSLWTLDARGQPPALGAPLLGYTGGVRTVGFAPGGAILATGGGGGTVILWDVRDRAAAVPHGPPLTGAPGAVDSIAFSPDGRMVPSPGLARVPWPCGRSRIRAGPGGSVIPHPG